MEIYLIRHTTPDVAKGICYGQYDLDITTSFHKEAEIIKGFLPPGIAVVYSSPMMRCHKLAEHLFNPDLVELHDDLKEIDCGNWEMQLWDELSPDEVKAWMEDKINVRIPGGESYNDVFERVVVRFNKIVEIHKKQSASSPAQESTNAHRRIAIVSHGGVMRSILSYITNTALVESFNVFSLHYSCVVKLVMNEQGWQHEILSNIDQGKETHKPSRI